MNPFKSVVSIDKDKCVECNHCEADCILPRYFGFPSIEEAPGELCYLCGHCVAACEYDAITHTTLNKEDFIPAGDLPTPEQMLNLIRFRRSLRTYKNEPVKREDLDKIIEAVRYSMTGSNMEDVSVVIIQSKEKIKCIADAVMDFTEMIGAMANDPEKSTLLEEQFGKDGVERMKTLFKYPHIQKQARSKGNNFATYNAPALLLLTAPSTYSGGMVHAVLAAQAVALLAPTLKMGACYNGVLVGAFAADFSPLMDALTDTIPRNEVVYAALMLGYEDFQYPLIPPRKERTVIFS